jgi:hypothetical protein
MMQSKLIGIDLSVNDLQELIREAVASELQKAVELFKAPAQEEKDLLTRKEAAGFLQISLVTLWKHTKEKLIAPKYLGSRVYYSKSELLNLLNNAA